MTTIDAAKQVITPECKHQQCVECPGAIHQGLFRLKEHGFNAVIHSLFGTSTLRCHCDCHGARV